MNPRIAGMGWVTPLGNDIDAVWNRLLQGDQATATEITDESGDHPYFVFRVPDSAMANIRHPRLRRASAISRFAAAAGLHALENAGIKLDAENATRIALIFAISNGGVIYTKRFYHDIVESGAQAASPLLFPETVFNAPASHLSAIIGVTGATYTLVGDSAVGILAIKMAADLMADESLDYCLVVGAEEVDWLLCDAYRKWRLLRKRSPIEPFAKKAQGFILSEGAGALLIGREGPVEIQKIDAGGSYRNRRDIGPAVEKILRNLRHGSCNVVIASANGTFIDRAELGALALEIPQARIYSAKPALGECPGAAGIWQTILATKSLLAGQVPPLLHASGASLENSPVQLAPIESLREAIVLSSGLGQQIAGLRVGLV